jgi:hypothetical protein
VRCEQCSVSTRGVALDYRPAMRNFVPVLFVSVSLLSLNPACNEPEPEPNVPGEFGEACVEGALADTPDGCKAGLYCFEGYCEERCSMDDNCQTVEGWAHTCVAGQCQIFCDADGLCPQTLATPLECWINGMWCAARDD